ncbi:hypothetical protein G7092_16725 [Mucilaginibacter sp. HC2]|uniref:nucleotide kinase domain-containing protein n=1 Tax=Mucilaginibacter inviolabilis TaxID=2714892 RepID=UPI00140D3E00|nr:nucleotide kinase domain-containing protein [Mucilaginibacter inviolabilis]NHA05457.1 hypothetical protein [Mucilaginibacter inviolabilis]
MSIIINKINKPKPSIVFDTYWYFAAERQKVFFNRFSDSYPPWSKDPIIQHYKFTNAYRITDRVSQYLVKNIIHQGDQKPEELLFRILLFKLFNKIETWELVEKNFGEVRFDTYDYAIYDQILTTAREQGLAIYSGAYIMASAKSAFGFKYKHQNHLKLLELIMEQNTFQRLLNSRSLEALYQELLKLPSIGSFLAYQYAIDINYSNLTDFSEMEFVKAGPGAKDGIRKCFSVQDDLSDEDIIKWMADRQEQEFQRLEIDFKDLWGRPLQLIDCQNLFCEVDKYARLAHPEVRGISDRTRIKQKFKPTGLKRINYCFPEKWQLKEIDLPNSH